MRLFNGLSNGLSNKQLKERLGARTRAFYSEDRLWETIRQSKTAFYEKEAKELLSHAEFLHQQSRYIQKRWWLLQGGILLLLWLLLELTESGFYVQRCMGVAAPLFAVLLLPELWKNRSNGALEIECAAYYSLRQIYAARIFLFALVDFVLLCLFALATILTGKMLAQEMLIQFFLPYIVACCICFRSLYSQRIGSEAFALAFCMVWCAVWMQLVLNENVYGAISLPIWLAMAAVASLYLGYCIHKGQKGCEEVWEVKSLWN